MALQCTQGQMKDKINIEFNIEGNCKEQKFVDLVLAVKPTQVTLVPDASDQLTSNHGWDTIKHQSYLQEMIATFKSAGIRTSIFVDADAAIIEAAKSTGADRIELYTESYAQGFNAAKHAAVAPFVTAAQAAFKCGLGVNAGHDLDRFNLHFFAEQVPYLQEVSIGHALICDAIYLGLHNTVQIYKRAIQPTQ
jgi:pyridoxine 5-phosphate synthase